MKKSKMLFALSASLAALPVSAGVLGPCKIPNPLYWGCLAAVKCTTAPVFGQSCGMSDQEFCNSLDDKQKLATETAKVVAVAAACKDRYALPKIEFALAKASVSCLTSQAGPKSNYCNELKSLEKVCPKPEYYDICPDIPWLPNNPVVNPPDPKEYAEKAAKQIYEAVSGLWGEHKKRRPYTGPDPAYIRDLTANYVNGTLIAAASDDFTSVGKFVADTVKAHADPADKKPPPNMYLEGLRSAVAKMSQEDLAGQVKAVALAIDNPMPREADRKSGNLGMTLHGPLWKEIAQADWSNPLAAAAAIGTRYRASYPHLSVMAVAESLEGSNAGPLGALVVAEFMRAGYKDRLEIGDRLRSYEGIMSPNGKYFLQMPKDGCNLLWYGPGIYAGLQQWRKDWKGHICELVQQGDGNVVMYDQHHKALWWGSSDPAKVRSGHYATVLQDDGNVVTYDDRHNVLWHSGSFKCKQHVRYWNDAKSDGKYCY